MNELKPCPFCGCDCSLVQNTDVGIFPGFKVVGFHDEECVFTRMHYVEMYDSEEEAIEAWNRRDGE
jgi:hypothetical protein